MISSVCHAMVADVIPASAFTDVIRVVCSERKPCLESDTSSIAPQVLLVSLLCIVVHKRKLRVWRAGACHIDGMCRLGYG